MDFRYVCTNLAPCSRRGGGGIFGNRFTPNWLWPTICITGRPHWTTGQLKGHDRCEPRAIPHSYLPHLSMSNTPGLEVYLDRGTLTGMSSGCDPNHPISRTKLNVPFRISYQAKRIRLLRVVSFHSWLNTSSDENIPNTLGRSITEQFLRSPSKPRIPRLPRIIPPPFPRWG